MTLPTDMTARLGHIHRHGNARGGYLYWLTRQYPGPSGLRAAASVRLPADVHHDGIDRTAATAAGQQRSRPVAIAIVTAVTRLAAQPPRPPPAQALDQDQADQRLHEPT